MAIDGARVPADLSRLLRMAAIALYGVFLTTLLPVFLPPRLIDPGWQLQAINAVLTSAAFPILATCCLVLAARPSEDAPGIKTSLLTGRMRLAARLASYGFVLLIPLLISALWRAGNLAEIPSDRLISTLNSVRREVSSSRTVAELNTALAKLPGNPRLPASFNLPIPEFQRATIAKLAQDLSSQEQEKAQRNRARRIADAFTIVRSSVLLSLFSLFFAVAARMPIPRPSLGKLRKIQPFKPLRSALAKRQKQSDQVTRLRQLSRKQNRGRVFSDLLSFIETGRAAARARARARELEAKRRQHERRPRSGKDNGKGKRSS